MTIISGLKKEGLSRFFVCNNMTVLLPRGKIPIAKRNPYVLILTRYALNKIIWSFLAELEHYDACGRINFIVELLGDCTHEDNSFRG